MEREAGPAPPSEAAPGAAGARDPERPAIPPFRRNVLLLSVAWCFGVAAAFMQLSATTLAVAELYDESKSTLPLGVLMASAAVFAALVPHMTPRYGKWRVYGTATCLGMVMAAVELAVVYTVGKGINENGGVVDPEDGRLVFIVIMVSCVPQGFVYACANNFRLTSVDYAVEKRQIPIAISMTMGGGIAAALVGPLLAIASRDLGDVKFAGSFLHLFLLYVALLLTLSRIEFIKASRPGSQEVLDANAAAGLPPPRSLKQLLLQWDFFIALLVQVVTFATMGALMSATPVSMRNEGFSYALITTTIVLHLMGMYVPSFWIGKVVTRFGIGKVMVAGLAVEMIGALLFLIQRSAPIYICGIVLVGVGWNFGFISATSRIGMLATEAEKPRLHALNDTPVLASLGISFLTSGPLYTSLGWENLALLNSVIIIATFIVVVIREARLIANYAGASNEFAEVPAKSRAAEVEQQTSAEEPADHLAEV
ncbi:Hypothetical Protein FCC1311_102892 [Hondaea fermentalgiana]|uniref:Major facilitator superfamily (MFS) profile domain-containing protein n=1 Tax=Hondaea fermentalgiana TaxID=2315210 RepID=A0A2R5GT75_9STRA|nr:Hypothetical Protein FCC1311_102892 [Hondaea fermentalgiana]|eukprot:GBG34066.1 Hypothetical Protein FCC1311_102892 [Hondaea fermentalgiana]